MIHSNIFKRSLVAFVSIFLIFGSAKLTSQNGVPTGGETFEVHAKDPEAVITSIITQSSEGISVSHDEAGQRKYFLGFFPLYQAEIRILLWIVPILFAGIILLFVFILINRVRKTRVREKEQLMKIIYQEQLTDYIYGDESPTHEFTGISRPSNRQILINEMLWLHRNLYGETAKRLHDLYFNLDLYGDSLKKLSSRQWAVKARGFRELAQMEVGEVAHEILRYVNSKNQILRMEAQLALVKLKPDDPLGFLDNLKLPLTDWEQVNILNLLQQIEVKVDSFERWMESKNETVVIFALKMAGLFNHVHSWSKVLDHVYHENTLVRQTAIKTLGLFELSENNELFKDFYRNHFPVKKEGKDIFYNLKMSRNRLAAIEAIEAIVTEADIPFLVFVLENEKEFVILQKTVNILANLLGGDFFVLEEIYDQVDPTVRIIIEQKKLAQLW